MQPAAGDVNPLIQFVPLILMFAVFYLLLIRPQQKREKERQNLIRNLKKGEKVVTTGGILGTVVGLKDQVVVLKVGDQDTKIEFLRNAISGLAGQEKE